MSFLERWLTTTEVSQLSQVSQPFARENTQVYEKERGILNSSSARELAHAHADPATPATPATPVRWVDMPDVVTVVEDLADEGRKPGQISRLLGLSRAEIISILRRTGR